FEGLGGIELFQAIPNMPRQLEASERSGPWDLVQHFRHAEPVEQILQHRHGRAGVSVPDVPAEQIGPLMVVAVARTAGKAHNERDGEEVFAEPARPDVGLLPQGLADPIEARAVAEHIGSDERRLSSTWHRSNLQQRRAEPARPRKGQGRMRREGPNKKRALPDALQSWVNRQVLSSRPAHRVASAW
ncbi:MAG: hypothetical protein MI923_23995, partial [Phycisphaerales bacterium]|nr:hypothetical protein [Phycisphaerales bacterium]